MVLGVRGVNSSGLGVTGRPRIAGGSPWRGAHPGVAAGPAAADGSRSARMRGKVPPARQGAEMTVGEGQRADRDDDQHSGDDRLVVQYPLEKPLTAHSLRLATR